MVLLGSGTRSCNEPGPSGSTAVAHAAPVTGSEDDKRTQEKERI